MHTLILWMLLATNNGASSQVMQVEYKSLIECQEAASQFDGNWKRESVAGFGGTVLYVSTKAYCVPCGEK